MIKKYIASVALIILVLSPAFFNNKTEIIKTVDKPVKQPAKSIAAKQSHGVTKYDLLAENSIESLVNNERQKYNLKRLSSNKKLHNSACAKAQNMLYKQYWAHVAPDGTTPWFFFSQAGYNYSYAGENLAYGFNNELDTVIAWMKSPEHRHNILKSVYEDQGICSRSGLFLGRYETVTVQHLGTMGL